MRNIVSIVQKNAKINPSRLACIFLDEGRYERRLTYNELDKKARAVAAYLQSKTSFGQRILLVYPCGLDFIIAFLGCLYAGAIAVPIRCPSLNDFSKLNEIIKYSAQDADISGILTASSFIEGIENYFAGIKNQGFIEVSSNIPSDFHNKYQPLKIKSNFIAYLQYTSGSTQTPKAAIIDHKNLSHNLKFTGKAWHYTKNSCMFTWTPHSHVYGLVCGLLLPLYYNSFVVFMPTEVFITKPVVWLEKITKYKITHSGCPNFGYEHCVRKISETEISGINLKSWKVAINGGENISYDTLEKFTQKLKKNGFSLRRFCVAYGMSELSGTIAVSSYHKKPHIMQSEINSSANCGKLLSGLSCIVVDPETSAPVSKGQIGELWLRGPSLSRGYWNQISETEKMFRAKLPNQKTCYFKTGDLGFIKNKEICFVGRLKDVIVIFGKKYYPFDLENSISKELSDIAGVNDGIAFSLTIDGKEELCFLQEISPQKTEQEKHDIQHIIRRCIFKHFNINLQKIILVAENSFSRTVSGKLQRKICIQDYVDNKLSVIKTSQEPSVEYSNKKTPVFLSDLFIKIISDELQVPPEKIDLNAPLSQINFDSINIVRVASKITESFGVEITPANLYEYNTLKDIFIVLTDAQHTSVILEKNITQHDDIAVIGMNGLFPGASDLDTFWNNLTSELNSISQVPAERWNWKVSRSDLVDDENKSALQWGGFNDDILSFDPHFFNISSYEAQLMDPQQRALLQIVWKTIEDAGYAIATLAEQKVGLFVGVFNHDYAQVLQKNNIHDAYMTTGISTTMLANRISYLLNLKGPSEVVDTACSSSLVALHHAVSAIHNNDCAIAIVGGINALLSPNTYLVANKAGMLSKSGQCKTFDKNADGYVRAEGGGAILLKPLQNAIKEGDHIYGIIKGTAVNHGGHVSSLTAPNPNAQSDVIVQAMIRAKIPVDSVSYIETHGSGTQLGDPVEINGLKKAFTQLSQQQQKKINKNFCALGALKSNIGHLEAAAGIAGVIKVLLSLGKQKIPANLHLKELNPYIDLAESPFYLITNTENWESLKDTSGNIIPRRAGVSSFGFGGTNAHVVVEEFFSQHTKNVTQKRYHLIVLSAKTQKALRQRVQDLYNWLNIQSTPPSIFSLSYTLNNGRDHFNQRCALVVANITELEALLHSVCKEEQPQNFIINSYNVDKERLQYNFQKLCDNLVNELVNEHHAISMNVLREKLLLIGNFYTEGYDINFQKLSMGEKIRISLPTYPFEKNRFWITENQSFVEPINRQNISSKNIQQNLIDAICKLSTKTSEKINALTTWNELGLDSIVFIELAQHLEAIFHTKITPALFYTFTTLGQFSEHLENAAQRKIDQVDSKDLQNSIHDTRFTERSNIAVIGMQGYFPKSENLEIFWQHLEQGDDLITEVPPTRWNWEEYYSSTKENNDKTNSKWGGFISGVDTFDATFFNISSREANLLDPQQRLLLEIIWKTLEDAGYDAHSLSNQKIGVFVGCEFNDYQNLIHMQQKIFHGHLATGNSQALLANRISYFFNFKGPSEVISTACSSSLVAIHRAVNAIQQGECSMALAAGVSLMLSPDTTIITSQLGALSSEGRCKTFDASADGYVKGEGIAAILLKPLHHANTDGNPIYGVIKGTGVNHGGKAQSLTAPNAQSQSELLIKVYQDAHINPTTISYIETHGTGTVLGDPIEIEGLKQAFNTLLHKNDWNTAFCGLGSVKTNIGHLEPASGIAGFIKVLLSMRHEKIPSNLHFKQLNPFIDIAKSPFYIVKDTQEWAPLRDKDDVIIPRRAGVSSFGFGGTGAHIIVEEYPKRVIDQITRKPYYLLVLSAKEEVSLQCKISELHHWLENHITDIDLKSLCYTHQIGRAHFSKKCTVIVSTLDELRASLQKILKGEKAANILSSQDTNMLPENNFSYQEIISNLQKEVILSAEDYYVQLMKLAKLYLQNYAIDWNLIYVNEKNYFVEMLPTYPFNKKRYWFDEEITSKLSSVNEPKNPNEDHSLLRYLQDIFAQKLRLEARQIDPHTTYEMYGVDSLLGLEITQRLENDFGTLPKTLLYERTNLQDLSVYFQQYFPETLQTLFVQEENMMSNFNTKNVTVSVAPARAVSKNQDIAIIGLSIDFPMAKDCNTFWNNLLEGRNCISEIPTDRWNYNDYPILVGEEKKYFKYGGFIADVDKFDPLFFNISPREALLMDPQERLFLQTSIATFEDAGYTRESLARLVNNNVGVFAGATYNFYPLLLAEEWRKGNHLPLDVQMFSIANRLSYFLNLNGPSYVVDTACSSSLAAIHLACESIQRGECQMGLAGGVNLSVHPYKYFMLGSYGFLSAEGRCASFGIGGSGYVPSEGVGAVLLKPLELALQHNDQIYGVIKSSSMNHGGKTSGYTVPNPMAQAEVIKNALNKGGINPRTISYVEAHGTGTQLGDPIEIRGLQEAFESFTQEKQFCSIGSVKSNIGHLESAAGISQLAKVLLQMKHRKLVPSLHTQTLNPYIDFKKTSFYVQQELQDWNSDGPRRAGISSFGAGGTNIHVIVEEFNTGYSNVCSPVHLPFIFLLSALNLDCLRVYVEKYYHFLKEHNLSDKLADICYTLQIGREPMPMRLAIIATNYEDLLNKLQSYLQLQMVEKVWAKMTNPSHFSEENISQLIKQKQYEKLIELWLLGTKIVWQEMYEVIPNKISLPTYPFAQRRCWPSSELNAQPQETLQIPVMQQQTEPAIIATIKPIQEEKCLINNEKIVKETVTLLADLLGLDIYEIDIDTAFLNYGLDSIQGIDFVAQLNSKYGDVVSPMDLYRYPTVNLLATAISKAILPETAEVCANIIESFPDEEQFMKDIAHLGDDEISKMLEEELI